MKQMFGMTIFHLYGVLIGIGILAGFWVTARMAREFAIRHTPYAIRSKDIWDSLWWVVLPAVIGARLYHVVDLWGYYRENLLLIPAVWTGGMGIFGAIFGGVLGIWIFARRKGFGFIALSDLAAFGLPVGQAIGRWGNFFNQELYGKPTSLPWAIPISLENRLEGYVQYSRFHPLFLYESLWSILTFGALFLIWRWKGTKLTGGSYFFIYLILYGVGRFFLEGMRIYPWVIGGINIAQAVSFASVMVGVFFLYSYNKK